MENETYYDEVETLEFQPSRNHRESNKIAPEIIEIEEEENDDEYKENKIEDVYVAVGKDDLQLLKWVLANVVVTGARVNLIHVSHPISSISTPGKILYFRLVFVYMVKNNPNKGENSASYMYLLT